MNRSVLKGNQSRHIYSALNHDEVPSASALCLAGSTMKSKKSAQYQILKI